MMVFYYCLLIGQWMSALRSEIKRAHVPILKNYSIWAWETLQLRNKPLTTSVGIKQRIFFRMHSSALKRLYLMWRY